MLQGLSIYESGDIQQAQGTLNAQIKSLPLGNLKISDLHRGLWTCVSKATKGQALV